MTRTRVIAIFDIGKTNKKFFLFDERYRIVLETSTHFAECVDDDGDPCEDLQLLTQWIRDTFDSALQLDAFDICAVNFSTYGASFVHLGSDGLPVGFLYNYLKPFPADLQAQFFRQYGGEETVSRQTASPVLGHLNSGLQLYFLKHRKPALFGRIRVSLHLPQYVSSLFTSAYCSEVTSIGCHTMLWDFERGQYHDWVVQERIEPTLPPIRHSNSIFEISLHSKFLYSGIGLHDSSAALIPYLARPRAPFVLLSTGTWCICLNPFHAAPLTAEELRRDCLCYLTFEGKPVKASRLFAGHFLEETAASLAGHFGVVQNAFERTLSGHHWKSFFGARNRSELKAIFDEKSYSIFASYDEAYTHLIEHIVYEQVDAIRLVLEPNIQTLYVDGGFTRNPIFMHLLATALPSLNVRAATVNQASALGAALAIHDAWNAEPMGDYVITD